MYLHACVCVYARARARAYSDSLETILIERTFL